jgi:hypothetical protein
VDGVTPVTRIVCRICAVLVYQRAGGWSHNCTQAELVEACRAAGVEVVHEAVPNLDIETLFPPKDLPNGYLS